MNVIRQILSKIVDSKEVMVPIESLTNTPDLDFHLSLLGEEGYIKKWDNRKKDNLNDVPNIVRMTWKGYDLYDQLRSEHATYLKTQGL